MALRLSGRWSGAVLVTGLLVLALYPGTPAPARPAPDLAYRELEGRAEEFAFLRDWRSYYWAEDFTFVLRDDSGATHRVISREPTPWTDLRLGTTYPGLKVDWASRPRVRAIGVQGVDRLPATYPGLKLEPARTVTALILRVDVGKGGKREWRDYYVNNWFHHWGADADRKVLAHYANAGPHYTVYGYLNGIAAPFDDAGKKLLAKHEPAYGGIIYHGRVVKKSAPGYEVRLLHLMARHKKTLNYDVFVGDPRELRKLDNAKPRPRR